MAEADSEEAGDSAAADWEEVVGEGLVDGPVEGEEAGVPAFWSTRFTAGRL
jgi:hypothetical protein